MDSTSRITTLRDRIAARVHDHLQDPSPLSTRHAGPHVTDAQAPLLQLGISREGSPANAEQQATNPVEFPGLTKLRNLQGRISERVYREWLDLMMRKAIEEFPHIDKALNALLRLHLLQNKRPLRDNTSLNLGWNVFSFVREADAGALGKLDLSAHPQLLERLLQLTLDKESDVRRAALKILQDVMNGPYAVLIFTDPSVRADSLRQLIRLPEDRQSSQEQKSKTTKWRAVYERIKEALLRFRIST